MARRPSFQFYPGDWLNDASLRMVSMEARSLWIDLLCIMAQCDQFGCLKVNQKIVRSDHISNMLGIQKEKTDALLAELENCGVFSVDKQGMIFSRRMVRDEERKKRWKESGCRGGNPQLKKETRIGAEQPATNVVTGSKIKRAKGPELPFPPIPSSLSTPSFVEAWERWRKHRKEIGAPIKPSMAEGQLKKFEEWGAERSIRAIEHTIFSGWQGLREPDPPRKTSQVPNSGEEEEEDTEKRLRRIFGKEEERGNGP